MSDWADGWPESQPWEGGRQIPFTKGDKVGIVQRNGVERDLIVSKVTEVSPGLWDVTLTDAPTTTVVDSPQPL